MRGRASLVALAVLLPRALAAQTSEAPPRAAPAPLRDAATTPGDAAPAPGDAAPGDAAARDQAAGAAALHAAQELEARVIELRSELDAMARERASYEDLRRRVDDLETRQATLRQGAPGEWTSVRGDDGLRVSPDEIVIRSPGNRFLLRPGLRLQALYEADLATTGPSDLARPDSSAFALSHAELLFEGHAVSPRFEYRLELDFAETLPAIAKDAFVQWRFTRSLGLRVGQFKVPYGLETQYWNALLEFVDVAQATAAFSLDREVGVMLVGRPLAGRLQYQLAVTDGPRAPCPALPSGPQCDQVDLAYAARIVAAPFGPLPPYEGDLEGQRRPLLSVGVSGAFLLVPTDVRARTGVTNALLDVDLDGRVDNVEVLQGGVELRAMFRGASLQAEWLGRHEQPGAGQADRSYWGAYGQAGYFVLAHHLEAVVRVGRTDLPLYGLSAVDRALRGSQTTEESAGFNAYLRGHNAKLQIDYTHSSTPDAQSAPTVHRIRAALQLAFF
jgi:phosphate-selective porin O/P